MYMIYTKAKLNKFINCHYINIYLYNINDSNAKKAGIYC